MSGNKTLAQNARMIAVVTTLSRIAGFVRYLVFGLAVGGGIVGTAYASANMLPNIMFEVLAGGALSAAIIPIIAMLQKGHSSFRSSQFISALLNQSILILLPISLLVCIFAQPIAQFILGHGSGSSPELIQLGAMLLRVFSWQLPLYSVSVILGAYLQSQQRFAAPAAVPLLSSFVVMATYGLYALTTKNVHDSQELAVWAVIWLGGGTTLGVATLAFPLIRPARQVGFRYQPTLKLPLGTTGQLLRLGGAGIGAVFAQQLAFFAVLLLAMRAGGAGTLPVFQYAQAIYLLPFAILVMPIVTTFFPKLAHLHATGASMRTAQVAALGMRLIIVASIAATAGLWAAAPAIESFFQMIDKAHVSGVGPTLAALAVGLTGYSLSVFTSRTLSAWNEPRLALIVGSSGWIIATGLMSAAVMLSATRPTAQAGTAFGLSFSFGHLAGAGIALIAIGAQLDELGLLQRVLRTAVVALPSGIIGAGVGWWLSEQILTDTSNLLTVVLTGIVCGSLSLAIAITGIALFEHDFTAYAIKRKPLL